MLICFDGQISRAAIRTARYLTTFTALGKNPLCSSGYGIRSLYDDHPIKPDGFFSFYLSFGRILKEYRPGPPSFDVN
jgi:hypothetical protein